MVSTGAQPFYAGVVTKMGTMDAIAYVGNIVEMHQNVAEPAADRAVPPVCPIDHRRGVWAAGSVSGRAIGHAETMTTGEPSLGYTYSTGKPVFINDFARADAVTEITIWPV